MITTWGASGDWAFRIVRECGSEPVVWHFLVEDAAGGLNVTQCGRGDPATGEWLELLDVHERYELGQICSNCAAALGNWAWQCACARLEEADRER